MASQSRDTRLALVKECFTSIMDAYEVEGSCFIVTPLLRPDNDAVTLRIHEDPDGGLLITDDGDALDYLRMSGYQIREDAAFQKELARLTRSFGVRVEHEEIFLETDEARIAETITTVARAVQHVSYLIYRHRARIESAPEESAKAS